MGFFIGGPLGDLWSSCGAPMGARMGGPADALWLFGLRAQVYVVLICPVYIDPVFL